ncbi:MAG: hypothetical protein R3E04_13020 [Sphingobium sp.]
MQTGSRIPVKPRTISPLDAGVIRKRMARCMLERMDSVSEKILEFSDSLTINWEKVGMTRKQFGKSETFGDCLGQGFDGAQSWLEFTYTDQTIRAMLQEEAYLKEVDASPALGENAPEILQRAYFSSEKELPMARGFDVFSDCVVYRDTAGADALLRTRIATKKELAAAQALGPALGAYLQQGQQTALTPMNIRMIVANGLWTRYANPNSHAVAQAQ